MNERIQELALQAGYTPLPGFDFANSMEEVFINKFAELIVGECVQILDDFGVEQSQKNEQPAHHPGLNFLVGLKIVEATWKIKTHFGVEE